MATMNKTKTRILIVDDEPEIVSILKHFFIVKGHEVIGVFSGEEALTVLKAEQVDLVLLDIDMPGMGGAATAQVVREKYPWIKLVVLTAYPAEGEKLATDTDLDGLFIKPVTIQDVYKKINDILGRLDIPSPAVSTETSMQGRVLVIKAKILIAETSEAIYAVLKQHFQQLAMKGEYYELASVYNPEELNDKLTGFNPDILILDISFLSTLSAELTQAVTHSIFKPKDTILDNLAELGERNNLERLIKTVRISCLKNGLIDVKWVDI